MAGNADVDAHPVEPTLVVMMVGRFDQNAATDDAVEERRELVDPFANVSIQRGAVRELVKRDLKWRLHGRSTLRPACQSCVKPAR